MRAHATYYRHARASGHPVVPSWIPAFAVMTLGMWLAWCSPSRAAELRKIVIGSVPSPTAVGTYIAIDKGYFRDLGIDVDLEPAQSAGAVMPMLASNRIQVVEGGVLVPDWNKMQKYLEFLEMKERFGD